MDIASVKLQKILEENARRQGIKKFKPDDYCFPRQLQFIKDPSRYKVACTGRRGGKTTAAIVDLIDTSLSFDGVECAFITETRGASKTLAWREIKKINQAYKLQGETNENELHISFPNGSVIFLGGANDEGEVRKWRGRKFKKIYIDECQNLRSSIFKELIDDVLSKTIHDYKDTSIIFIGTPGKVLSGHWYDICHRRTEKFRRYSVHHWTVEDNERLPSGKSGKETLKEIAEEEEEDLENPSPTFKREWLGEWISIANTNVLNFDPKLNEYVELPDAPDWQFVIGIDIGYLDSDAIAVLGFSEKLRKLYLVHEYQEAKKDYTELGNIIKELHARFNPIRMVADTGGGGRKGIETIKNAFHLPIQAADKTGNKNDWWKHMDNDLKHGRLFVSDRPGLGECAIKDMEKLLWDQDREGRLKVKGHSDILDAFRYAYRSCYYLTHQREETKSVTVTTSDFEAWAQKQMQKKLKEVRKQQRMQYWQKW